MNRVLMLEFNELSPVLMDRFIAEGHLPAFRRLRDRSATGSVPRRNSEPWYAAGKKPLPKQSRPPGGICPVSRATKPGRLSHSLPRL